jgi:DNA-binding GntR family transcriptional regulator
MVSGLPVAQIDFAPLHERVYDELRSALISGKFSPGQKLTSRKLAAALGTSDMPVRAAISRLTAEGGLIQLPNGTFIVPVLSQDQFREVMELRALLEGRATALACGHIDANGFRRLHRYSLELDAASKDEDIVRYLEINQKLKFTIYAYCSSSTLRSLIELLWLQAGPVLRYHSKVLRDITRINFHRQAIASLERGDRAAASRAIARDIKAGMRTLLKVAQFRAEDERQTAMRTKPLLAMSRTSP